MDMISSKELADAWQISVSRIVRLAKAGRIPGAKLIGKSWVFPPDTQKPADTRRKENRSAEPIPAFRFPLYFYTNYTPEEVEKDFSPDERMLYKGEHRHLTGKYAESCELLESLLKQTDDRYVRFGALYYLCLGYVYQCRFVQAYHCYDELILIWSQETLHKAELEFPIHDIEAFLTGNSYYADSFAIDPETVYPFSMTGYLFQQCAYSDIMKAFFKQIPANPAPYELFCHIENADISPLVALSMHMYLSVLYSSNGNRERSLTHIRESCRIAEENRMERSISYMVRYKPELFEGALLRRNPEQLNRLKTLSAEDYEINRSLMEFNGKHDFMQMLNAKDIGLISLAARGLTNKEVASVLHLSANTVNKKYASLFIKTGTHSKKELVQLFKETVREY